MVFAFAGFCMLAATQNVQAQGENAAPVYVLLQTNYGDMTLELDAERAPISVKNFLDYVESGHYVDTVFHRVIKDFMIQGGGYTATDLRTEKKTLDPIKNEGGNGLKNLKYTLAMARTSEADSATSQFFINTVDNDFLDRAKSRDRVGYAVFGKVIKGQEIVDDIAAVKTSPKGPHTDCPVKPVTITGVKVIEKPE